MSTAGLCYDVVKLILRARAVIQLRELEPEALNDVNGEKLTWFRPEMKEVYYNYSLINKEIHDIYLEEYNKQSDKIVSLSQGFLHVDDQDDILTIMSYYSTNPQIKKHPSDRLRIENTNNVQYKYFVELFNAPIVNFSSPSLWKEYFGYFLWYRDSVEPIIYQSDNVPLVRMPTI